MKKTLSFLLFLCLLVSAALAAPTCPRCLSDNQPYVYCTSCGTKMPETCPACDWYIPEEINPYFCGKCGLNLEYQIGKVVRFGDYEQDNNLDNGTEPIEWVVLDVKDGYALLLSVYSLDAQPYDTEGRNVSWLDCSLRAWLNDEFYHAAFAWYEQSELFSGKPFDNEYYAENDRVFLLDYDSAVSPVHGLGLGSLFIPSNYISNAPILQDTGLEAYDFAPPTAYARSIPGSDAANRYWDSTGSSAYIEGYFLGFDHNSLGGVRPAIWVKIP